MTSSLILAEEATAHNGGNTPNAPDDRTPPLLSNDDLADEQKGLIYLS